MKQITLSAVQVHTLSETLDQPANKQFSRKQLRVLDSLVDKLDRSVDDYDDANEAIDRKYKPLRLEALASGNSLALQLHQANESDEVKALIDGLGVSQRTILLEDAELDVLKEFWASDSFTNFAPLRKITIAIDDAIGNAQDVAVAATP